MGKIVGIKNDSTMKPGGPPRIICSRCKKEIVMDITIFKDDVTKIIQDKCPYCRGEIFTGMLILSHPDLKGLMQSFQVMITALNTENKILGG